MPSEHPAQSTARAIRRALREGDVVVNIECFNDQEAHEIAWHLTREELERVRFRPRFKTGARGLARLGRFVPGAPT